MSTKNIGSWNIAFIENSESNEAKYFILEEIDRDEFHKEIEPLYDYEYLEDLILCVNWNIIDLLESIKKLTDGHEKNNKSFSLSFLKKHQVDIQRTFFNVINTHKALIDHTKHTLSSRISKDSEKYKSIDVICSHYYDTHCGYKIIENLRNYCQHKSMAPIIILREPSNGGYLRAIIAKEVLKEDETIKKKLKAELDTKIEFDFGFLFNDWVKEVNEIYEHFLDIFAEIAFDAAKKVVSYRFFNPPPEDNYSLCMLMDKTEDGKMLQNYLPEIVSYKIIGRIKEDKKLEVRHQQFNDMFKRKNEFEQLIEKINRHLSKSDKEFKDYISKQDIFTLGIVLQRLENKTEPKEILEWLKNIKEKYKPIDTLTTRHLKIYTMKTSK